MTEQTSSLVPISGATAVLKVAEAAEVLATGENELRALLHAGELSHYTTPGGHYRIPAWAIDDYTRRKCEETRLEAAS